VLPSKVRFSSPWIDFPEVEVKVIILLSAGVPGVTVVGPGVFINWEPSPRNVPATVRLPVVRAELTVPDKTLYAIFHSCLWA
jgi:hypothetical protein